MAVTGFIGGALQIEFVASVKTGPSNSAPTINVPGDFEAGDLLVLFDVAISANAQVASTVPSGFTRAIDEEQSFSGGPVTISVRAIVSYKIAVGNETTLAGLDGNSQENKILLTFRGVDKLLTAAEHGSPVSEITDGNPAAQVVALTAGGLPLVCFGYYVVFGSGSAVNPRIFTVGGIDVKDDEINGTTTGGIDAWAAYKIFNKGKQNVTVDMDDEAGAGARNILQSGFISVSA